MMNKHQHLKECRLVHHKDNKAPFHYAKPINYYVPTTQRSINLTSIIFNDYLAMPICKKPLNAYYIRDLMRWVSQSPQSKISHRYLFKNPSHSFKISYDLTLVHKQIIRNQQQSIQD